MTFSGKFYLKDLLKHTSVLATFNIDIKYLTILLYRMANTFKLGYEKTNNYFEYFMILVAVLLLISSRPFKIHGIPLITITSMLLTKFLSFKIYFLLEPVPCAPLVYQLTLKKCDRSKNIVA